MLTTAAWPAASRKRRPLSSTIQQPSPRAAMGNVFFRFREKSPLVGMARPPKIVADSHLAPSRYNVRRFDWKELKPQASLVRTIGRWSLAALMINTMVGASIFGL